MYNTNIKGLDKKKMLKKKADDSKLVTNNASDTKIGEGEINIPGGSALDTKIDVYITTQEFKNLASENFAEKSKHLRSKLKYLNIFFFGCKIEIKFDKGPSVVEQNNYTIAVMILQKIM